MRSASVTSLQGVLLWVLAGLVSVITLSLFGWIGWVTISLGEQSDINATQTALLEQLVKQNTEGRSHVSAFTQHIQHPELHHSGFSKMQGAIETLKVEVSSLKDELSRMRDCGPIFTIERL